MSSNMVENVSLRRETDPFIIPMLKGAKNSWQKPKVINFKVFAVWILFVSLKLSVKFTSVLKPFIKNSCRAGEDCYLHLLVWVTERRKQDSQQGLSAQQDGMKCKGTQGPQRSQGHTWLPTEYQMKSRASALKKNATPEAGQLDTQLEIPRLHLGWGYKVKIILPPSSSSDVASLIRLITPLTVHPPYPPALFSPMPLITSNML